MKLKLFLLLFAITSFGKVNSQKINHKKISNKANEEVKLILSDCINKKEASGIFDKSVICAPKLWEELIRKGISKKIKGIEANFHIPIGNEYVKKKGRIIKSLKDFNIIWSFLIEALDNTTIIRKPNYKELQYYAAILSPEIEEPLFVVENINMKILIDLSDENKSILFIELI